MKISIGAFDAATRTVAVTFEHDGVRHERAVNTCLDAKGGYDATATAARVDEVGRGVEYKIEAGVIGAAASPITVRE
ncbi:hypothetical protein [Sphingomonas sp. BK069]|uniref:hypothetical protein n=1 Tax=Sphingomonas sp. BK069 TaxID=2586979 RepID=UPI0016128A5B|nr:hypothetical protein [Sphingomonas sp. BK069]MBB3346035.1 hypothetical protein [Sphingomonas sp. BK069]